MGSSQMSERQVLDAVVAEAIRTVFEEYVDKHGLGEIADIFAKGVRIEVGDLLPSAAYARLLQHVPPVWDKAFEVNAARRSGRPRIVCRVRLGRFVRHRPDLPGSAPRTHHL